ncbi:MAG: hypothetical protein JO086_07730 [Acidimicrobiia bacterium]|nr:hypothetical protein [Acidimicrobiia bacterium]
MKRFAVVVASAALLTFTPAAASAVRADPAHRIRFGTTKNWAGYAAHGGPFTSVSTTWTEPSVTCGSTRSGVASFAGIDGAGSPTVEQIGTLAMCRQGKVTHRGFVEMYPKAPIIIRKPVSAGDSLTATVVANSSTSFTLTLVDHTKGWTYTTNQTSSGAALASAEAITEAPTVRGSGILPLANFGSINYSGTTANGQPLANFGPEPLTMANNGSTKAVPTQISGGSFSVLWQHA